MLQERSSVKIALVGASCTGKTTLIEYCRENYRDNPQIAFVEEGARAYFSSNPVPERFTVDVQRQIQRATQQNEEEAHASGAGLIICDSSTVDQVVYTRALHNKNDSEVLFDGIKPWIPTYDKFFMLNPTDVVFQNDAIRTESFQQRQRVHDTFRELFAEKQLHYQTLSGTVAERFSVLNNFVQQVFAK